MERLVDKIRERYFNPSVFNEHISNYREELYCQLGAYLRYIKNDSFARGFPSSVKGINQTMAADIMIANRDGNYELAWDLLEDALQKKARRESK